MKLDRLRVGTIELTNIDAAVLEGSYPVEVLLGMSFLGRLNVQHQGELMIMQTKKLVVEVVCLLEISRFSLNVIKNYLTIAIMFVPTVVTACSCFD